MNRAFYIVGIVFSVVFLFVCAYYVGEVSSARSMAFINSMSSYNSYDPYYSLYSAASDEAAADLTTEAGLISVFFFLYFIFADLMGLLKVKTKTIRVFSIIGLSLGAIFLLWDVLMMSSPSSMSFDEIGAGFVFYALIALAFSIVGLIQSVRFAKRGSTVGSPRTDLLDS